LCYELSIARRQNDNASMDAAGRMAQVGFTMLGAAQLSQHTYIIDAKKCAADEQRDDVA
jgi:hypothetical protein